MTSGRFDKLTAIAATSQPAAGQFVKIPYNLNDKAVVDTLKALGVTVPATMQAAHARGQALKTANSLLPISSVDAALTRAGVDVQNRIRFKTALSRHGILGQ